MTEAVTDREVATATNLTGYWSVQLFGVSHENYRARILRDSISPEGIRLTTIEVTHPRFVLAEFNTHRVFSRNSASSRAIPPEKQIERVLDNPFIPEKFNQRVKGMGIGEALSEFDYYEAAKAWINARDHAVNAANRLIALNADKSRINRLLEPFMWHTAIITSTEWDNFFALRTPPGLLPDKDFGAQIEFQIAALAMRHAMDHSEPDLIGHGQWHLPLVADTEVMGDDSYSPEPWDKVKKLSSSRCARVSFDKHTETEPEENTIRRHDGLIMHGHLSPTEHAARPFSPEEWAAVHAQHDAIDNLVSGQVLDPSVATRIKAEAEFCGNFRGWVQYRKEIPNEACFGRA